ncbi:MAG TPA: PilZ domain-containing protein [Parvularculaceae bacterium]|nr:PilZ domain-containing protein [Parvularculaceae bacterium]
MPRPDLRRYRRFALDLPARITVNGIDEYQGRLVNISPGDLAVKVEAKVVVGDAAIVAIKDLDIVEGRIARVMPDGFALSFLLSRRRRQILIEKLMLLVNPAFADGLKDRRATPRHPMSDQRMVCRLADGSSLFVRVLDRSVDGISVDAPRKPPVGSDLHIGRARAVIVRHTPRGFVAVFEPEAAEPSKTRLRAV